MRDLLIGLAILALFVAGVCWALISLDEMDAEKRAAVTGAAERRWKAEESCRRLGPNWEMLQFNEHFTLCGERKTGELRWPTDTKQSL